MRIAVMGTGYVGLGTGATFAAANHDVVCLDILPERVVALNAGECPIFEPGLPRLLKAGLASGKLRGSGEMTVEIAAADLTFICVGTPSRDDGSMDMTQVKSAAATIGDVARLGGEFPGTFQMFPSFVGFVADRLFNKERVNGILHLLGGGLRGAHGLEDAASSKMHRPAKIQPEDDRTVTLVAKYLGVWFPCPSRDSPIHGSEIVAWLIEAGFIVLDSAPLVRRQMRSDTQGANSESGEIQRLAGSLQIDELR